MWVAVAFVAIALTGTGFMSWFLLALLRESAPSTWYWIVPIHRELERGGLEVLSGGEVDDDGRVTEGKPRDYYVELLEDDGHAQEYASGLIALAVHPVSDSLVCCSILSKRGGVFRERRLKSGCNDRTTGNAG